MSVPLPPQSPKEEGRRLQEARALVLEMGALAERQILDAIDCLVSSSGARVDQVLRRSAVLSALARSIDALAGQAMERGQPATGDLRLLIAALKVTADLERIGDEAKKIALHAHKMHGDGATRLPCGVEPRRMAHLTLTTLRAALVAFERLDPDGTVDVVRRGADVDDASRTNLRQLIGFMVEGPRTISACLDQLFVDRALERVSDHARNIAEHAVYAVKGADARRATLARIAQETRV
jgi:phosphate transport system protein